MSGIRAHVGGEAARASEAIGAEAYATGNSVAFREAPSVFTAAHEAAHVIQQRAGVQLLGGVGEAGDVHEQNADAVAARVVAGQSAVDLLPRHGGSGSSAVQLQELQAKTPTQVANQISHPPFSWLSAYEVVFTDSEIQLKIKAKLEPQAGVSKDDILDVGLRASDAFRSYYDSKFIFTDTDTDTGKQLQLRCSVAFVDSGEHTSSRSTPVATRPAVAIAESGSSAGPASSAPTSWVTSSDSRTSTSMPGHRIERPRSRQESTPTTRSWGTMSPKARTRPR